MLTLRKKNGSSDGSIAGVVSQAKNRVKRLMGRFIISTNKQKAENTKEKNKVNKAHQFPYAYSQSFPKKKDSYKNKSFVWNKPFLASSKTQLKSKIKGIKNQGGKKAFKTKFIRKTLPFIRKKLCVTVGSFRRYYKTIITLNQLKQYEMFAKTPFVNNQLADIIFFISPEKNQNLVDQANSLKIPTIGIVSGSGCSKTRQNCNNFRFKDSVYYPILGNPYSDFFTRAVIGLFIKILRVGRYTTVSKPPYFLRRKIKRDTPGATS